VVPIRSPSTRASLLGAACVAISVFAFARPAGATPADPPGPTDFRSTVTSISPATDVVELQVIGGDAFVQLRAADGHEVVVLGRQGEPYLRFGADGTVSENRRSPDTYANADRYGDVQLPADIDADAAPVWQRVASHGVFAWHDHRIHLMTKARPEGVRAGQPVMHWNLPLQVDGRDVTVEGVLRLEPTEPWWPWAALVAAGALVAWFVGRRRRGPAIGTLAAGAACVAATVVATGAQLGIPAQAGRSFVTVVVPAVGVPCAAAALVLQRTGRVAAANVLALAATAAAGGWAILRVAVFTKPVLPTDLPADADRAGTACAMALAFAAAVLLTRRLPAEAPAPVTAPAPVPVRADGP
jgi:hypothetical protein